MSAFLDENGLQRYNQKILAKISTEIAKIIADAPESFDTLKEIATWISSHSDSASSMNQQINKNAQDISSVSGRVTTFEGNVLKKSDVVNNLTSASTNTPLSAKQGKELDGKISEVDGKINKLTDTETATVYTLSVENGLLCLDDGA